MTSFHRLCCLCGIDADKEFRSKLDRSIRPICARCNDEGAEPPDVILKAVADGRWDLASKVTKLSMKTLLEGRYVHASVFVRAIRLNYRNEPKTRLDSPSHDPDISNEETFDIDAAYISQKIIDLSRRTSESLSGQQECYSSIWFRLMRKIRKLT